MKPYTMDELMKIDGEQVVWVEKEGDTMAEIIRIADGVLELREGFRQWNPVQSYGEIVRFWPECPDSGDLETPW